MSKTSIPLLLISFTVLHVLLANRVDPPEVQGLENWLKPLDQEELDEIYAACQYKRTDPSPPLSKKRKRSAGENNPKERVIDGTIAPKGKYPFAGVLTVMAS